MVDLIIYRICKIYLLVLIHWPGNFGCVKRSSQNGLARSYGLPFSQAWWSNRERPQFSKVIDLRISTPISQRSSSSLKMFRRYVLPHRSFRRPADGSQLINWAWANKLSSAQRSSKIRLPGFKERLQTSSLYWFKSCLCSVCEWYRHFWQDPSSHWCRRGWWVIWKFFQRQRAPGPAKICPGASSMMRTECW
jgi:hypothetical protein